MDKSYILIFQDLNPKDLGTFTGVKLGLHTACKIQFLVLTKIYKF